MGEERRRNELSLGKEDASIGSDSGPQMYVYFFCSGLGLYTTTKNTGTRAFFYKR